MSPLTIVTPTFNRSDVIGRLVSSLENQTTKDFEWILVDDGSDAANEARYREIAASRLPFPTKYIRQVNMGKHVAHNTGVLASQGELIAVVDDDDWLYSTAVQQILGEWALVRGDPRFGGLALQSTNESGALLGGCYPKDPYDALMIDCTLRRRMGGDQLYVFRTDLLKTCLFPTNIGRFVAERLVYHNVGSRYLFRHRNTPAQFKEYRPDGLTARVSQLRFESPRAALACYSQDLRIAADHRYSLAYMRALLNFGRFMGICWVSGLEHETEMRKPPELGVLARGIAICAAIAGLIEGYVRSLRFRTRGSRT